VAGEVFSAGTITMAMPYMKIFVSKVLIVFLLGGFSMVLGQSAWAHGEGASYEEEKGEYFIDIGYAPEEPLSGVPVRIDFALTAAESGEEVLFTDVWVRIHQERETFFASGIHKPHIGETGLVFTFPEAGDYEISVRYQNDNDSIVDTTFVLPVEMGNGGDSGERSTMEGRDFLLLLGIGTAGFAVGFLAAFVVSRRSSRV